MIHAQLRCRPRPDIGVGSPVDQDWDAVASAITDRMRELGMRQRDLAYAADVGLSTVQELVGNTSPRRRNPKTLSAISDALGLPSGALMAISLGEQAPQLTVQEQLDDLRSRMDTVERRLEERGP